MSCLAEMNDALVIVGAGPAGAAAALTARRVAPQRPVVLLDRAAFPRDKSCGDAISPDAVAELAKLGVSAVLDGATAVERLRLRAPRGHVVADAPPAVGYVVPRTVFDDRLVRAAVAAGARLHRTTVRSVTANRDGVTVDTDDGPMTAAAVIGADGANSIVRRATNAGVVQPQHMGVAVRAYAPAPRGPAELLLVWERGEELAYAWSFGIGDGRCNVGYGVFGTADPPSRAQLVERMHALIPHSVTATSESIRGHRLPLSSAGVAVGSARVLLAGDAASLINPVTGEGIFYALLSGRMAASAAVRDPVAAVHGYRVTLHTALGAHIRSTRRIAAFARRGDLLDRLVWAAERSPAALEIMADLAFGKAAISPSTALRLVASTARSWRGSRHPD